MIAARALVVSELGTKYATMPKLDLADVLARTTEHMPIIFLLSPGADPASEVFRLGARDLGMQEKRQLQCMGWISVLALKTLLVEVISQAQA